MDIFFGHLYILSKYTNISSFSYSSFSGEYIFTSHFNTNLLVNFLARQISKTFFGNIILKPFYFVSVYFEYYFLIGSKNMQQNIFCLSSDYW